MFYFVIKKQVFTAVYTMYCHTRVLHAADVHMRLCKYYLLLRLTVEQKQKIKNINLVSSE